MKRTLLITTLLALSAGSAMADVSLSGDGRMGLLSTDGGNKFAFESRARVRFSLSSETAQRRSAEPPKPKSWLPTLRIWISSLPSVMR